MCRSMLWSFALLGYIFLYTSSQAKGVPKNTGQCVTTRITWTGNRFFNEDPSLRGYRIGSAVIFANGGFQVSYETVPEIEESKVNDQVRMCLVSIPKNCPKGDDRGREYFTTNLRTKKSWRLPDSQHYCGGA